MIQHLNTILEELWNDFLALIPNILISLLVLGIGYLLAFLVKYLIKRFMGYIGKQISQRFSNIDLGQAGTFIGTAFFWLIIFSSILLITDILGLTILTSWFESILKYLPNVFAAILIIFAAIIIGNFIAGIINSVSVRVGLDYSKTLGKIVQFIILFTAIIIAIDQVGIEITFLINIIDIVLAALLFGAALAFGLGARISISNILGAFYVRKMYKEGDEIQIGEIKGTIISIEQTTVLLYNDDGQVSIPAKEFNEKKSFLINKK